MSVLKNNLVHPSRMQGIFRYLLHTKGQREKKEVLGKIISPDKLVENKSTPRPMFNATLNESIKCGLLVKEDNDEIVINPALRPDVRNPQLGEKLLPDTLADLFFASHNEDEEDFGRVCAWYLAQDIYDALGTEREVELCVNQQQVGELLKMSNNALFGQMDNWMRYLGFAWGHNLKGENRTVPDPTSYIKRNLPYLFNQDQEILLKDFITRLAEKCPLFETGKFREEVEAKIGQRQPKYLSTSTAFALFRLQDEGYIKLDRKSDGDLMLLPKINDQVDDDGRISHIIWKGEK